MIHGLARARRVRNVMCVLVATVALAAPALAAPSNEQVPLPSPEPGSYFTVFDYAKDGRIVAFDGFTVYLQTHVARDDFTVLGTLPERFRGKTDPAFVVTSPNGRRLLLGAGAGGSAYPDPEYNGNVFELSIKGGTAQLVGRFPFSIDGAFYRHSNHWFAFGQGETFGVFVGSVELLDLRTGDAHTIVARIPGDPGGIAFDRRGNLYVGLGAADDDARTGEIRRFDSRLVRRAVLHGAQLDFESDGEVVAEVLNAGDFDFDREGHLLVGGGDFAEPDLGYVAELDVVTGEVIDRFDPVDGDVDDGDFRYFEVEFSRRHCRLGALDLNAFFDPSLEVVYQTSVCGRKR